MMGVTHAAAGTAVGLGCAVALHLPPGGAAIVTAYTVFGSLFPDIDVCSSILGRWVKFASLAGHRTMFHAPLLYLVTVAMLGHYSPDNFLYFYAMGAGVASHLILDMLNSTGIPVFWPVTEKRFHVASFRSSGVANAVICLACLGFSGFKVIQLCQSFLL